MDKTSLSFAFFCVSAIFLRSCSQTIQEINHVNLDIEPEFIDTISNVTYPAGREAILACTVRNLGNNKVGWLRASDQTVLALQGRVVTHNARISVTHENFHTWKIKISKLRESDKGCYMCQINTSPMKKQIGCIDVQVPPDILNEDSSSDLAVPEGEDAILTCKATGNPSPRVIWKREDGEPLLIKKTGSRELTKVKKILNAKLQTKYEWRFHEYLEKTIAQKHKNAERQWAICINGTESFTGASLKLVRLERRQMGAYLCIASNDVPPAVSKRISLSVQFAPMVRAPSQLLGTPLGSDVQLECHVEASPSPVSYWLKGTRVTSTNALNLPSFNPTDTSQTTPEMLLDGPKYGITERRDGYKGTMLLIVRSFSIADVGTYHCVSTNSLGRAEGTLRLYEIKLHPELPSSIDDNNNYITGLEGTARGGNSESSRISRMYVVLAAALCVRRSR